MTGKTDTLRSLAAKYVKFRGKGVEREWRAIYAFNWREIKMAWSKKRIKKKRKPTVWDEGEDVFGLEDESEEGGSSGEDRAVEGEDGGLRLGHGLEGPDQIGRASCRGRVWVSVGDGG